MALNISEIGGAAAGSGPNTSWCPSCAPLGLRRRSGSDDRLSLIRDNRSACVSG